MDNENNAMKNPLFRAVKSGDMNGVERLVQQGADVKALNEEEMTPVQLAAQRGHWNVVKYLVVHGAAVNNPVRQGETLILQAITADQWDVVKYLVDMGGDVNIHDSNSMTPVCYAVRNGRWEIAKYMVEKGASVDELTAQEKDDLLDEVIGQNNNGNMHKAFYNVIRVGNIELLELLIQKEGLNDSSSKRNFENVLANAYEDLKIENVPLSPDIEVEIENKLIRLRFFTDKTEQNAEKVNSSLEVVRKRIDMVCEQIGTLSREYSDAKEVDDKFLLVGKFVVQNIRILKRQLRSTYHKLPWEEIEFCVTVFISPNNPHVKDSLYKLVLDKERLLNYLHYFGEKLNEEKTYLQEEDVNSKFPPKLDATLSARDDAVSLILNRNPLFQDLYDDFQLIKNVYSLNRIESHIKVALSINLDLEENKDLGRLVIERTLQVIGESLKNSIESPNVSANIHQMLLYSAPSNVREIITLLRDSLSHAHTLRKRIDLEENENPRFFKQVQNDLRKIQVEITDILYKKNLEIVIVFLKKITKCDNISEFKKLANTLSHTDFNNVSFGDSVTSELALTKTLIEEVAIEIKDHMEFEEERELLTLMMGIIKLQEVRLRDVKISFKSGMDVLTMTIGRTIHDMTLIGLDTIKNMIRSYLEPLELQKQTKPSREIAMYAEQMYKRVEQKMVQDSKSERIKKLLYDIKCTVEFDANRVKGLDIFKDKLEKQESASEKAARDKMNGIFEEMEESIIAEPERKLFKEIIKDNMEKFRAKENLNSLFDNLRESLVNRDDEHVVQKYTDLVRQLSMKKNKKNELYERFNDSDWNECRKLVESLGDKYQTLLNSVKNSLNPERATDLSSSFKRFFGSRKLNPVIDNIFVKTNSDQFLGYYEKRLHKLNKLLSSDSGSVGNAYELVTKYDNNRDFQSALDMVVLDLTDILENISMMGDNRLFLDGYSPLLVGKSLRNYLAHGDVLIDSLQSGPSAATISNAILLIEAGKDLVTMKEVLIGQRIEERLDHLQVHYNDNMDLINKKIEMFVASKEKDVAKVVYCVDNGADIYSRDSNGWTGMHYAAQGNNVDNIQYFLGRGFRVDVEDINGKNVLRIAAEQNSNNVIKYLVEENRVDVKNVDFAKQTLLHYAAHVGASKDVIELLLARGALVDARDEEGSTPLYTSAQGGHEETVLMLLKNGANVDARQNDGWTPMHMAAFCGHQKVVDVLLQHGATVDARDKDDWTPLHMVALNGHRDMAVMLLQNKARVNARGLGDSTPMHLAAFGGKVGIIEELIKNGANVNAFEMNEITPLHMAVTYGQKDVVVMLLKNGADVNVLNEYKESPLHIAVLGGSLDMVLALLKRHAMLPHVVKREKVGIEIDILNKNKRTPLFLAAMFGYRDIVAALLMVGANKESRDEDDMTPLLVAALKAHEEVVGVLLESGANIHAQNKDGSTTLHCAAHSGVESIVRTLLDHGSDVNEQDNDSYTPLHIAAKRGHSKVVATLLDSSAKVNAQGIDFITPLHMAAKYGNEEVADVLCLRGADVDARLVHGSTPLLVSANYGQHLVTRVLLKHGAKVDTVSNDNMQALHFAAQNGFPKVATILLDNNADVNAMGLESRMPLHLAAQNGHQDVATLLLENEAKVNALDKKKSTPLHLAVEKDHIEVVDVMLANKADVNSANENKIAPLHVAAFVGNKDITTKLLEHGALVDVLNEDSRTPLHFSAFAGHKEVARELLNNQSNVDSTDTDKMTPLHMAAEQGKQGVAMLLADRGADVNAHGEDEKSPLHLASEAGHTDVVNLLLERGAEVDALDNNALTPLQYAIEHGKKDVTILLLENGADFLARNKYDSVLHRAVSGNNEDILTILLHLIKETCKDALCMYNTVNAKDSDYDTPLMLGVRKGNVSAVELLLKFYVNVNARNDKNGKTALHYAIENVHLEIVQILIDNKANASIKDVDGDTAGDLAQKNVSYTASNREKLEIILTGQHGLQLASEPERQMENQPSRKELKMALIHLAAINGNLNAVVKFLEDGINVNVTDETNMMPLHYAAMHGRRDVVNVLIKNKAEIDARNMKEWTPLMFASSKGHKNVVQDLLENNADVNAHDLHEVTSLHIAVVGGFTNIVETLLKNGANVEMRTNENMTALHLASESGLSDAVVILLENGANIEETANDKMRALHYAARNGHSQVVKIILERRANIEARDKDSWTALHYTAIAGNKKTLEVLLQKGANIHSRAKDKMRAIHYASAVGHREVVKLLLANGADVDAFAVHDKTAAHYAASNGHKDVIEELLDNGAKINAQTIEGMTPLHYGSKNGHREVVESLLEKGADINLRESHGETAEDLARKEGHSEITDIILKFIMESKNRKKLEEATENLATLRTELSNIGLEALRRDSAGPSGPSCSWQLRKRRDTRRCAEEESSHVFPYEPFGKSILDDLHFSGMAFSHVTMAVALEHSAELGYDVDSALDSILTYIKYIGDINSEPEDNRSHREKRVLADHYKNSKEFLKEYPLEMLFTQVESESSLLVDSNATHQSWLFQNNQHLMVMFHKVGHYQLYSADFNFRYRFQTREDITFDEVKGFIRAFFKWRSGSSKYNTLRLKESLPTKLLQRMKDALFWTPEQVAPDIVVLTERHFGLIESLPAEAVRKLFILSGKAIDVKALHPDFFVQHRDEISLQIEALHKTLPLLNESQIQVLLRVVQKYECPVDESYDLGLTVEERALIDSYRGFVANELETKPTISLKRLSEISWEVLEDGLGKHPGVSEELKGKVLSSVKEIHASASHRAWLKGMGTQTLFFLPDIIRATNTGDVSSLVQTGAMLTGDATVNNLYTSLVNNLEAVVPESRVRLLRTLPVTSPVFKALTIYSIVELTRQLNALPPNSEVRSVIEHKLGEQYMTAGLMVAEMLGFQVTPLWIGLIAEQLLFEADAFRKQNHLAIKFWEALLMSLGFEQDKFRTIVEERQLANLNLAVVNRLNKEGYISYGWIINKSPKLYNMKWNTVPQDQVPTEIRKKIYSLKSGNTQTKRVEEITEWDGYRQVNKYKVIILWPTTYVITSRGKQIRSFWQKASYDAALVNVTIEFSTHHNDVQSFEEEDNIFLDEVIVDDVTYRRVPSVRGGRFLNGIDPIKRDMVGVAVYVNNNTYLDTTAQSNFYVGFDPREGDLNVDFTDKGLEMIDSMNVIHNLGAGSPSTFQSYNASSTYLITVQVGPKPYPNAIEFLGKRGVFTLMDNSRRIVSQYVIHDSIDSMIKDSASATRIFFSSSRTNQTETSTCSTINTQGSGVLHVHNRQCSNTRLNITNSSILILNLNHKKYLELHLNDHVIEQELEVSAEHVAILEAKGEAVGLSTIHLGEKVNSFNITIRGDIVINSGTAILQIEGKVPLELQPPVYKKAMYNKVYSYYELTFNTELRSLLDTMSRLNIRPSDLRFSTADLKYWWQNKLPEVNFLKIEGKLDENVAFLNVGQTSDVLQIYGSDNKLKRVEVKHYGKRVTLEIGLILREIIRPATLNSTSRASHQLDSTNSTGGTLMFSSPQGYQVYHHFLSSDFSINNIGYVFKGKRICVVSGDDGSIDGRQLIHSSINKTQSKPGQYSTLVCLCFDQALNQSNISVKNHSLVINGITLQHIDESTNVYFQEQAFPMRSLKDSLVRSRVNIAKQSTAVLLKRSVSEKQAQQGPEYVRDINTVLRNVNTNKETAKHILNTDRRSSGFANINSYQRSCCSIDSIMSTHVTSNAPISGSSVINNMFSWIKYKGGSFLSNLMHFTNYYNEGITSDGISALSCKTPEIPLRSFSFQNSAHLLTQFNLNGTLALADLLIRNYTKVKSNMSGGYSIAPLEAQALALNITSEFQEMLTDLSQEHSLSMEEFQFNPAAVQNKVFQLISNSNFSQLPETLLASIQYSWLAKGEDNGVLRSIEEMLSDQFWFISD